MQTIVLCRKGINKVIKNRYTCQKMHYVYIIINYLRIMSSNLQIDQSLLICNQIIINFERNEYEMQKIQQKSIRLIMPFTYLMMFGKVRKTLIQRNGGYLHSLTILHNAGGISCKFQVTVESLKMEKPKQEQSYLG